MIVSSDASDLWVANQVARRLPLAGIVVEHQRAPRDARPRWEKLVSLLPEPRQLANRTREALERPLHRIWMDRILQERPTEFGVEATGLQPHVACPVHRVEAPERLNDDRCSRWIGERAPDLLLVCGAGLLGPAILEIAPLGALNLHSGLSQFYRGLFTTEWAILDGMPERIGGTVHLVSRGIDDGGVLYQFRPELVAGDHPNRSYEKVMRVGVEALVQAAEDVLGSVSRPQLPATLGRLCRRTEFNARQKRRLWRRWRSTMTAYARERESRDAEIDAILIHPYGNRPSTSPRERC